RSATLETVSRTKLVTDPATAPSPRGADLRALTTRFTLRFTAGLRPAALRDDFLAPPLRAGRVFFAVRFLAVRFLAVRLAAVLRPPFLADRFFAAFFAPLRAPPFRDDFFEAFLAPFLVAFLADFFRFIFFAMGCLFYLIFNISVLDALNIL